MDETLLKVYFLPRIFKRLPEQDVCTTFYKTRRNSNYPCILVLVKRYQITFLSNSSGIFSSVCFNDLRQECFSGSQDRENVKERSNKNCSTRSNLHSQLNICSSQNGITVLPIVKPEKSQSVHLFRNGRAILVENENVERGLYVQDRPEEGIFFSPTQPKV